MRGPRRSSTHMSPMSPSHRSRYPIFKISVWMFNLISIRRACKPLSLTQSDCYCPPCLLLVFTHAISYALHAYHTHFMICSAQSKSLSFPREYAYDDLDSFLGSLLQASRYKPIYIIGLAYDAYTVQGTRTTRTRVQRDHAGRQSVLALDAAWAQ